ncbi:MAG: alpha/beta hydrolase-fold protein [Bryobacteraceae bacterium]|nr:alpha/beta hydrolase-fold protein [Bryobacteraceae bacterium]
MKRFTLLLTLAPLLCAQSAPDVFALARKNPAKLAPAVEGVLKNEDILKGAAFLAHGPDFLFVTESASEPKLMLNGAPGPGMAKMKGAANRWFAVTKLPTSRTHNFHYLVDGKPFGGRTDLMAYSEYHYLKPGVPQGKLSEKRTHTSAVYEGMVADYWVYAPAGYNANTPAAVMFWTDGEVHINRDSGSRALNVWDNLTHEKKIPVIIQVLVSPGLKDGRRWRSIQYDSVDDRFARYVLEEILPEVGKTYNLRKDGYSRAIAGDSSGAICALNAGWWRTAEFSRILLRIGSFTSIQWPRRESDGLTQKDGGHIFPYLIRKSPRKNLRIWMQDGFGDLENDHGSWPATNLALVNSLKLKGYDFRMSWGNGTHSRNGGNVEMAEEMIWLWRGWDPSRTSEEFVQDPAEKDKPFFRITSLNRTE